MVNIIELLPTCFGCGLLFADVFQVNLQLDAILNKRKLLPGRLSRDVLVKTRFTLHPVSRALNIKNACFKKI